MGSGRWSSDVYSEKEHARHASGKGAFDYSDSVKKSGHLRVHPSLDPRGVKFRESRDSTEHPESNAVSVFFDVTGSMGTIPTILQKDLPQLLGLLLYKDYIGHPQILFGAIGDATSDRVPLQVGQFESDNRMDEHLQNLVLEGGGGPYGMESYELALYFMARHTVADCWEKRRKKGYFFMIGDEMAYPAVKRDEIKDLIAAPVQENTPLAKIIMEVKERYNVFYIIPTGASGGHNNQIYEFWKKHLGEQHVLQLDNPEDVARVIAMVIGRCEGTIDVVEALDHLRTSGATESTIDIVKKAMAVIPAGNLVVKGGGSIPGLAAGDETPKTRRL